MSESTQLQQNLLQARESLALAQSQVGQGLNPNDPFIKAKEAQIARLESQISTTQTELTAVNNLNAPGTASAGQVVKDDGTAGIQNPDVAPTTVAIQTDATGRIVPASQTNQDLTGTVNSSYVSTNGTTASTLSLTNSQGTPASNTNTNSSLVAEPTTSPGVGAQREDNTAPSTKPAQQIISASFNQQIIPQPNVLDAYSTYTYGLSWYMLTPKQYSDFTAGSRNISTWSLLAQTGGANQIGRNQFFQLDYYIDNLIIESYTPGKASGLSHSALKFEFTVTEPNGLTLIPNLHNAVTTLFKETNVADKGAAYLQAQYCMVIRFYGYDDQGNLVNPIRGQGLVGYPGQGSTKAIVEKYYPFVIQDLKFRLVTKQIEYHITCNPIPYQTSLSQDRGSIPLQFELVGETVSDILVGKPVGTQYPTADTGARETTSAPAVTAPSPAPVTNNQTNTLPPPANATNAYVDSTGVDFGQLSG